MRVRAGQNKCGAIPRTNLVDFPSAHDEQGYTFRREAAASSQQQPFLCLEAVVEMVICSWIVFRELEISTNFSETFTCLENYLDKDAGEQNCTNGFMTIPSRKSNGSSSSLSGQRALTTALTITYGMIARV